MTTSSRMRVMNHNWSAMKQRLHPHSVAEISRHSVLSGDMQYLTMWDIVCVSPQVHRSVSVSRHFLETTVAEGGRNPVAGLWGHTLGENWTPEPTSSYASIDFWCQLGASPTERRGLSNWSTYKSCVITARVSIQSQLSSKKKHF